MHHQHARAHLPSLHGWGVSADNRRPLVAVSAEFRRWDTLFITGGHFGQAPRSSRWRSPAGVV
jgi:hypothetical protein